MNLVVTHEKRFQVGEDGNIYTDNENSTGYFFFKRYLEVFDSVTLLGRAQKGVTSATAPVTGPGVTFVSLPYFWGPMQYLRNAWAIKKAIRLICSEQKRHSAFIARCPSIFGGLLVRELIRINFPYALEIVSDPFDVFSPGSIKHPLRPFLRVIAPLHLKRYCSKASAVSYVTQSAIQQRYPASVNAFTTHFSSIRMDSSYLTDRPRIFGGTVKPLKIVTVCTLEQLYKGTDTLIEAVDIALRMGADVHLNIVGDGKFRPLLEELVCSKGIKEKVNFLGRLAAGDAVKEQYDRADLFVLPSKGEGLPRAMIEAMARGLPCLGTAASGIPELLPPEDMVPVGDVEGLAKKIAELSLNPSRMNIMSARNLEKSKEYQDVIINERRNEFYSYIKNETEMFIESDGFKRSNSQKSLQ
jgi:glycosyltransferase involved in cell wall biosynthesis